MLNLRNIMGIMIYYVYKLHTYYINTCIVYNQSTNIKGIVTYKSINVRNDVNILQYK